MTLKTLKPKYSISVYKLSKVSNTLTYKVNLQSGYSINKVNVRLTFDYIAVDSETGQSIARTAVLNGSVNVDSKDTSVFGSFDISGYNLGQDTLLRLEIVSVEGPEGALNIGSASSFKFGR